MNLESLYLPLLYLHIGSGAVALLTGSVAIISKKGKKTHKNWGKTFYLSMLCTSFAGIALALLPNHFNLFLMVIGLFSSYLTISAYQALHYKSKNTVVPWQHKALSIWALIMGVGMIGFCLVNDSLNLVLLIFGLVSSLFGFRDLRNYKNPKVLKENWLKMHLGKMMGAYISAVTAFIVANTIIPGIWAWFLPSIPGTIYIVYWSRKIS